MTYYCVDYSELLIESLSVCAQVGYCHSYLSAGQCRLIREIVCFLQTMNKNNFASFIRSQKSELYMMEKF